ncbi:MAG: hypothetical protein HY023_19220 [Chloroflexi bacterium]|nr:hypothetical protein [Chloroflexota bacterium]MBI3762098.1 hypothetical protein [Chloroflexota bacterium]
MIELTLQVKLPDELARQIQESRERLPEILELGLRELTPLESRVFGEILDFLSRGATPEQIVAFRSSEAQRARVRELLERNSIKTLSEGEEAELDLYERLEHLMIMLKARARRNLPSAS